VSERQRYGEVMYTAEDYIFTVGDYIYLSFVFGGFPVMVFHKFTKRKYGKTLYQVMYAWTGFFLYFVARVILATIRLVQA
jgi:hypothetical protein